MEVCIRYVAEISKLGEMMKWIHCVLECYNIDHSHKCKFEIAIEETLINIINHAYVNCSGNVEICYSDDGNLLSFKITDQGISFNPLERINKPNVSASIDERVEGGLGIYFIHQMTDHIDYQRIGNSNILTLSKKI